MKHKQALSEKHPAVQCAVSSLLGHVSVVASEALARAGALDRLVVLEARVASRRDMTGCGCPQR